MIIKSKRFTDKVLHFPYKTRKAITLFLDLINIFITTIESNYICHNIIDFNLKNITGYIFPFSLLIILTYIITGKYKELTKYITVNNIYVNFLRNFIPSLIYGLINIENLRYYVTVGIVLTINTSLLRYILSTLIRLNDFNKKETVIIYGAGNAGAQLASSLIIDRKYELHCFIDDNEELWNRSIYGHKIRGYKYLTSLEKKVDIICLCIPSLTNIKKQKLLSKLQKYNFRILTVPTLDDLNNGKATISNIRPINIEDLMIRDISSEEEILDPLVFYKKNICITGGGGSIGSELCRQIIKLKIHTLVILESSEINLYYINQELLENNKSDINIVPMLGSVTDEKVLEKVLKKYRIDILLHSSAYKHVPLVEQNPLSGMENNIISSYLVCKKSLEHNLDKVLLISSDKAVRPTNIMGVTKRISELIFINYKNKYDKENTRKTKFSAVRFGNVLGSSGSVVPLFKKQIQEGGPITLTHPDIIRYFMTIKEASNLVLQSICLSNGGETFLLDMGVPVKIKDLAQKMIKLSGLSVKNRFNPNGDIEIKYSGLRDGEKLYEELLIDGEALPTKSKYIYMTNEDHSLYTNSLSNIEELIQRIKEGNLEESISKIKVIVPEWKKSSTFEISK